MTNERFENKYITNNFREIDFRRAKMEKETILPLNNRERGKYVNITSIRLVKRERKNLFKSVAILTMASFKLGAHIFADYSLWWILDRIRFYGKYTNSVEIPRTVGLNVNGKGFVANLFRSVIKAFNPLGKKMDIDTVPCLPDPIPPDIDKYIQIGFILILCWFLAILEPYGLRLRVYVMNSYHPARARERAVWLYNHVLRNRTSFLKFARRALKRKFIGQKDSKDTKITCKEFFRAKISNGFLRFCCKPCLGEDRQDACVLCAEVFRPGEEKQPIRCATPGCPGIYCEPCFTDLQNLCTICLDPIQYGDLSDIDEEKDSSEDENSPKYKRRVQQKVEKKSSKESKENDDSTDSETNLISRSIAGRDFLLTFPSSSNCSTEFSDSGNSTEYSYSYQYTKNFGDLQSELRAPFVDLEQQKIPDYVAMDTFQDYLFLPQEDRTTINEESVIPHQSSEDENVLERKLLLKKRGKPLRKLKRKFVQSSSSSESETDIQTAQSQENEHVKYFKKENRRKVMKWLQGKAMFRQRSYKEETIPLLTLQQNGEDSSCSEEPKTSTIYSRSNPTESLKSEQETFQQTLNNKELKLNDSSVDNTTTVQYSTDMNSKLNYLFPNLNYEEVCEHSVSTPNSSYLNTSRTSSSELTVRNRRKQFSPSTNSLSDVILFSLENNDGNSRKYREKIRRYYKTLPRQTFLGDAETDKKNKIVSFFYRLFRNP